MRLSGFRPHAYSFSGHRECRQNTDAIMSLIQDWAQTRMLPVFKLFSVRTEPVRKLPRGILINTVKQITPRVLFLLQTRAQSVDVSISTFKNLPGKLYFLNDTTVRVPTHTSVFDA